jgi:hypothetical protein
MHGKGKVDFSDCSTLQIISYVSTCSGFPDCKCAGGLFMTLTTLCPFPRFVVVYQMYLWMDLYTKECKLLIPSVYLTRS